MPDEKQEYAKSSKSNFLFASNGYLNIIFGLSSSSKYFCSESKSISYFDDNVVILGN